MVISSINSGSPIWRGPGVAGRGVNPRAVVPDLGGCGWMLDREPWPTVRYSLVSDSTVSFPAAAVLDGRGGLR